MRTDVRGVSSILPLPGGELWRETSSERARVPSAMTDVDDEPLRRLTEVFRRDSGWVFSLLRRFGVHPGEVEDITQEVFLVLRARLADVNPGEERKFLFRTAAFLAANARRAARRRGVVPPSGTSEPVTSRNAERELAERDDLQLLQEILDVMSEDLRAAFVLYEIEELTLPEIAEILAVPIGTVKSRLLRARRVFEREAKRRGVGSSSEAGRSS
ncbi:MAG: polymerase sigma factor RpoE [Labilithrix sp.]|nr:polymerase sigma factor RpoE [Labilithrix sp.]